MSSAVTDAIDATGPTEHERLRPQKPRGISADKCAQMMRYLLLAWDVKKTAEQCNVSQQTVYTVENNLVRYGGLLFEYLMAENWRQQDEMAY